MQRITSSSYISTNASSSWTARAAEPGVAAALPDDIADADPIGPLGPAGQVRRKIAKHLPSVDWSDATYGVFEGAGFTIELNAGDDDPIDSMMLHVRGEGDVIAALLKFANPNGWALLDCSTSEFLDPKDRSAEGWEGFQTFRDKAIGRPKRKNSVSKEKQPKHKKKRNG